MPQHGCRKSLVTHFMDKDRAVTWMNRDWTQRADGQQTLCQWGLTPWTKLSEGSQYIISGPSGPKTTCLQTAGPLKLWRLTWSWTCSKPHQPTWIPFLFQLRSCWSRSKQNQTVKTVHSGILSLHCLELTEQLTGTHADLIWLTWAPAAPPPPHTDVPSISNVMKFQNLRLS